MAQPTSKISDWRGCYDDDWKGVIVPEAFVHPAPSAGRRAL